MNQPQITKLAMMILMEPDLDAAVAFYNQLGLPIKFRMKDTWAEFELGGIKIGLCQSNSPAQENRTGIVLQVTDLAGLYENLKDSIRFLTSPIEAAHGIMTSIQDPGGNIIDLYQPTPEKIQELIAKNAQKEDADACCKPQPVDCCKKTVQKQSCC